MWSAGVIIYVALSEQFPFNDVHMTLISLFKAQHIYLYFIFFTKSKAILNKKFCAAEAKFGLVELGRAYVEPMAELMFSDRFG